MADGHIWEFTSRFRRHAYGWMSLPAIQRVKQAVSEIRKVARKDPVLAAEGAVTLLERLSPALEQIDSSSGATGTAVNEAITTSRGWPTSKYNNQFKGRRKVMGRFPISMVERPTGGFPRHQPRRSEGAR